MERAERLRMQKPIDKDKLYAFHVLEVSCISKGKARKPYDGHMLAAQLEQTRIFLENVGTEPQDVFVDNPKVTIHHRGKHRSMTQEQRRWLKRRQSIDPVFGQLKNDHRMDFNWLKGDAGDAMHAILCAAGYITAG